MSKFILDLNATQKQQKEGERQGTFLKQQSIQPGGFITLRFLPPTAATNGIWNWKVIQIWINKQPFYSPRMFGEPCPILDKRDAILKGTDDSLKALLNSAEFSVNEYYAAPVRKVEHLYEGHTFKGIEVAPTSQIFEFSWTIVKQINDILANRSYANGSPLSIFDPKVGRDLDISKKVEGKKTIYTVQACGVVTEMPNEPYDNLIDMVGEYRKQLKPLQEMDQAFTAFLYGGRYTAQQYTAPQPTQAFAQPVYQRPVQPQQPETTAPQQQVVQETTAPQTVQPDAVPKPIQQPAERKEPQAGESITEDKPLTLAEKLRLKKEGKL